MFNWCLSNATGPNAGVYDATNATGTGIGGFNDWYIPAKNELEILYYNLKPSTASNLTSAGVNPNAVPPQASPYTSTVPAQTTANGTGVTANFRTGGAEAFSTASGYRASTEPSTNTIGAWIDFFNNGDLSISTNKTFFYYVRAIRRVAV
jgi:hypothetical protein